MTMILNEAECEDLCDNKIFNSINTVLKDF